MVTSEMAETLKIMAPIIVNIIPGGAIFYITNTDEIIFKEASNAFDVSGVYVGAKIRAGGGSDQAILQKRKIEEKVPRSVYGIRVNIISLPIIDGDGVRGCLGFVLPRLHPVAAAFNDFAPIMTAMFHEGAFMYMTDLEKIGRCQGSEKFNLVDININDPLTENTIASKVIKSKRMIMEEIDPSKYGVHVRITCYPCFDEDDSSKVVATLGIIQPRETTFELRGISTSLDQNLGEIMASIQEMAAGASEITMNEHHLHNIILEISNLSEEINDILGFIKQLADETKMLGLNAAIEAARAGDIGKGFGVVAEEIRKLSDESKTTVGRIRELTNNIKEKVGQASEKSNATLRSSEEQAAASEEMSASLEGINVMSKKLKSCAEQI